MSRHWAVWALPALLATFVLVRGAGGPHSPGAAVAAAAPSLTPTAQPSFILRPHTARAPGTFAGHHATLEVYPAIPGSNAVRLSIGETPRGVRTLSLAFTMPGMKMPPVTGTVRRRGSHFIGTMRIPMFGIYHVVISGRAGSHRYSGVVHLALPILFTHER